MNVCLRVCVFVYVSVCFVWFVGFVGACLFACLFVCVFGCLLACLFVCLCVCLLLCLSVCPLMLVVCVLLFV